MSGASARYRGGHASHSGGRAGTAMTMRNTTRAVAVLLVMSCGAGCSIRQDGTGVTRTGVGLWGFGDPPGVNWNLDWPRREVPDLPASRHPELPPRAVEPGWWSGDDADDERRARARCDRRGSAIGDNRACVSCCLLRSRLSSACSRSRSPSRARSRLTRPPPIPRRYRRRPRPPARRRPLAYRVEVIAPSPLKETLERDVGLARWQGYAEMTVDLLDRLAREAIDESRNAAAAMGYFSAVIDVRIDRSAEPVAVTLEVDRRRSDAHRLRAHRRDRPCRDRRAARDRDDREAHPRLEPSRRRGLPAIRVDDREGARARRRSPAARTRPPASRGAKR